MVDQIRSAERRMRAFLDSFIATASPDTAGSPLFRGGSTGRVGGVGEGERRGGRGGFSLGALVYGGGGARDDAGRDGEGVRGGSGGFMDGLSVA